MKKPNFKIRPIAFIPAAGLLLLAVGYSIFNEAAFYRVTSGANDWLIANFGGIFSIVDLLTVIGTMIAYFSPMGEFRIGGGDAIPTFSRLRAFYVTLCTTIAAGVIFWGTVEPMYHISAPPYRWGSNRFHRRRSALQWRRCFSTGR